MLGFAAVRTARIKTPGKGGIKPQMHVFYADRVADVADELPKWDRVPGVGSIAEGLQYPHKTKGARLVSQNFMEFVWFFCWQCGLVSGIYYLREEGDW